MKRRHIIIKLFKKLWSPTQRNIPVHATRSDTNILKVRYKNGEVKEYFFDPCINEILNKKTFLTGEELGHLKMVVSYIKQYGNPYPTAHLNEKDKD